MSSQPFHVAFVLYTGVTQLDFTGPCQVFSRVPGFSLTVASLEGRDIVADGLTFTDLRRLEDLDRCDLVCVPGGQSATAAALDPALLGQVRRLCARARWVTSVCTGSLILGAAGLLEGKRAACHWAWRDLLPLFGAIPDSGRVVRDGHIITGGGVSAGIDLALEVVSEVAGSEAAQAVQLMIEYAPAPPFTAGRPESAPASVLAAAQERLAPMRAARRREAEQAAAAR